MSKKAEIESGILTSNEMVNNWVMGMPPLPDNIFVNSAGVSIPPATSMKGATYSDRIAPDQFFNVSMGTAGEVGKTRELKLSRLDLNPGLYGQAYIVVEIPKVEDNVHTPLQAGDTSGNISFNNGYSFIQSWQVDIGDQRGIVDLTGDEMFHIYNDLNTEKEAMQISSQIMHTGTWSPWAMLSRKPIGSVSYYESLNFLRRTGGVRLRIPVVVPWCSPDSFGLNTASDMLVLTGDQQGMKMSFTLTVADYTKIIREDTTYENIPEGRIPGSRNNMPQCIFSLEMMHHPRSSPMCQEIWLQQLEVRPLAASFRTEVILRNRISIPASTTGYKVTVPMGDYAGLVKMFSIVAQSESNMADGNFMCDYFPIDSYSFKVGNEPKIEVRDTRSFNSLQSFRRVGEPLQIDNTNAALLCLGQDMNFRNYTGALSFLNKNPVIELEFSNAKAVTEEIQIKIFLFYHSCYGPTGEWKQLPGQQMLEFVNMGRGDYEQY